MHISHKLINACDVIVQQFHSLGDEGIWLCACSTIIHSKFSFSFVFGAILSLAQVVVRHAGGFVQGSYHGLADYVAAEGAADGEGCNRSPNKFIAIITVHSSDIKTAVVCLVECGPLEIVVVSG